RHPREGGDSASFDAAFAKSPGPRLRGDDGLAATTDNERMNNIRIGTASWTDKSLIESGKFYPASATKPEDRLRYYASQFPLVEVDSSYYAIPTPTTAQLWSERTPPTFRFNVKAFRLFTLHQTSPTVLPKHIREALPASFNSASKKNIYY